MKIKLFLILLLISHLSFGQKVQWYEGKIKFANGESQSGLIAYYSELLEGLVRIKHNGMIKTYSSKEIDMFYYYDEGYGSKRIFYSLPVEDERNKTRYFFFEMLCETDNLYSLQKEISFRSLDSFPYSPAIVEHYIMFKENNMMKQIPLRVNHKSFPPQHKKMIKYYIKETYFDENDPCHQLDLIEFYLVNTRAN